MSTEKNRLVAKVNSVFGRVPDELRTVIKMLSHPDVIKETITYFNAEDPDLRCRKYESPWNCILEVEARYENVTFGWVGGASGVGYYDGWCENCRKRVLGS